jgi:signal transduction histidine kinase
MMINECVESIKKISPAEDVNVIKKLALIENIVIQADPLQLKELFTNILNNAIDAVSEINNAIITIKARLINHKTIEVSFHDSGVGISSTDLSQVFTPFFTTKAKGTGLGLAVCKQIVALHNGSITIKSSKNKGTIVTVTLSRK